MIKAVEDKIVALLMRRTKSTGGIILPETTSEPQAYCLVVSVGDKVIEAGSEIKEGDILVCHIRAGMDSVIGNKFIKVLKLDEVYGVLTDEETISALKVIELTSSPTKPSIVQPSKRIVTP